MQNSVAKTYLALKKPEEAVKTLKTTDDPSFDGLTHEVMGDAYLAMNKPELAAQCSEQAISELPMLKRYAQYYK